MKGFISIFLFMSFSLFAAEAPVREIVKDNPNEPEKKKFIPTREIAVIVTQEGYYPKSIQVFEGEKIKFYVTSTVEEPNCLIVESHNVFMGANKGKLTEAEVVFDKAGDFAFYCPSTKNGGRVVVMKKYEAPKREPASKVWMPKEF